jgi:alanine-glyoxylate transaminase/serine-glyoxylate transaminase/serine-pyruvate transaminase
VTVGASQKGLMLPPGLSFVAVGNKALSAAETATLPRAYWHWDDMRAANENGFFPYTPATNLLFGLAEALDMLAEEGLDAVFARHARFGAATRAAVDAWGLETSCAAGQVPSDTVTAVVMPDGLDADDLRALILDRFDMSLGTGLGRLAGRAFRIGHLGHFNDLALMGTLAGVEMGLRGFGLDGARGGVEAAMAVLTEENP